MNTHILLRSITQIIQLAMGNRHSQYENSLAATITSKDNESLLMSYLSVSKARCKGVKSTTHLVNPLSKAIFAAKSPIL